MVIQGKYPWAVKSNGVPGSDGFEFVVAVEMHVTRFQPGDRAITALTLN